MAIGRDFRDANLHAEATAYYNDGSGTGHTMHGIGSGEGDVVGTDKAQTLTLKTLTSPTISNPTFTGTPSAGASIVFEGSTADAHETTLTVAEPTQDNEITLPNTTGTVTLLTASQTISWDPTYISLLGLDKNSFHRVLEDNYEEKFLEITDILKTISENVIKKH